MLWQSTVSGVLLLKEGASKTQAMHLGRFVQISSWYKLSLWILYVAPSAADCMNVISVVHFFSLSCLQFAVHTHTHTIKWREKKVSYHQSSLWRRLQPKSPPLHKTIRQEAVNTPHQDLVWFSHIQYVYTWEWELCVCVFVCVFASVCTDLLCRSTPGIRWALSQSAAVASAWGTRSGSPLALSLWQIHCGHICQFFFLLFQFLLFCDWTKHTKKIIRECLLWYFIR